MPFYTGSVERRNNLAPHKIVQIENNLSGLGG
jgi:hypothetical protein